MGEMTKLCQIASKNSVKCNNNIRKKEALFALARGHGLKFIFSLVIAQFDFFVKIVKNCISNQKPTNLTDRINRALGRRRVQYTHYLGLGTG